jgi:hypothetical protein
MKVMFLLKKFLLGTKRGAHTGVVLVWIEPAESVCARQLIQVLDFMSLDRCLGTAALLRSPAKELLDQTKRIEQTVLDHY